MSLTADPQPEHRVETYGGKDHDPQLVHELSRRLDALWRYDQYFANAAGPAFLKEFRRTLQSQEMENIKTLKGLLDAEGQRGWF